MMERHIRPGEPRLEVIDFASTRTIFDPENGDAWLTIAWDYDALAAKKQKKHD